MTDELPPEWLQKLLRYVAETGRLYWLQRPPSMFTNTAGRTAANACGLWNSRYAGKEAFTSTSKGYRGGSIFGRTYQAHRVIWALHHGCWPNAEIDHIDGNPTNNRLENLRPASRCENRWNRGGKVGSSSQYCGVSWSVRDRAWRVAIRANGHTILGGSFACEVDAARKYDRLAKVHHREFARLNFPENP